MVISYKRYSGKIGRTLISGVLPKTKSLDMYGRTVEQVRHQNKNDIYLFYLEIPSQIYSNPTI
jgi:hypothetical protein